MTGHPMARRHPFTVAMVLLILSPFIAAAFILYVILYALAATIDWLGEHR